MAQATLIKNGQKVVVDFGSPQAQQYFNQGYTLMQANQPAQQAPSGSVPINGAQYNTKGLQQANFSNITPVGNTLYGTPRINKSDINTGNLTIGNPDFKQPPAPDQNDPTTFINGYLSSLANSFQTNQNNLDQQRNDIKTQQTGIIDLIKKIQGKGDAQVQAENNLGVNNSVKHLQELNAQIAARTNEFNTAVNAQEGQGRGLTTGLVSTKQNAIRRQQAVEIGGMSAAAQALQGNIALAQDTAKKTVDLQYKPLEDSLDLQLKQLEFNYNDLTAAEKKQADNLALLLDQRKTDLQNQKEEKQNIYNVMLEAAKNGADTLTINKIMNSKTVGEAISNAEKSLAPSKDGAPKDIGNGLYYDPITKTVKTIDQITPGSSNSTSYFTDANGINWNVAGWASNDASKVASMQNTANMIGKVTDANIEQKVAQFTPGITADMIKKASALTGVSWEAIMAQVVQESTGGTSNVAIKNNNFGGLTFNNQEWIKQFGGTKGSARPASEGGNYIKFPTKQDGLNALAALQASYGVVNSSNNTSKTAQEWATAINNKKATLSDVKGRNDIETIKLRNEVVNAIATTPQSQTLSPEKISELNANIKLADDILNSKGLNSSVGTNALGRTAILDKFSGQKQNFIASVNQLISSNALNALIEAKKQGATFGALSDRELDILSSSATKLKDWAVTDKKTGKIKGFNISEPLFRAEIKRMQDSYTNLLNNGVTGLAENNTSNSVVEYNGIRYSVDANGNMTPIQ